MDFNLSDIVAETADEVAGLDDLSLQHFEHLESSQETIGKGSFGVVQKIRRTGTDKIYALKSMRKAEVLEGNLVDQVELEIKVQQELKHPNVLRLYRHFEDSENVYLLLEFCAKGELYQIIRTQKHRRFSEPAASMYFVQVASGLQYLHANNIVHRDIKPENLLVNHNDILKIGDFGWCADASTQRVTFCGTLDYLAPEMIQGKGHNHTLDIWSAGVLLYEMVVGRPPFQSTNHGQLISKILKLDLRFPAFVSPGVQDLVAKLLKPEPRERLALAEAEQDPWVLSNRDHKEQPNSLVSETPEGSFLTSAPPQQEMQAPQPEPQPQSQPQPQPQSAQRQRGRAEPQPAQPLRSGRKESAQGVPAKAHGAAVPTRGGVLTTPAPNGARRERGESSAEPGRQARSAHPPNTNNRGQTGSMSAPQAAVQNGLPRRSPQPQGAAGGSERRAGSAMRPAGSGQAAAPAQGPHASPAVVYRPVPAPSSPTVGQRVIRSTDQTSTPVQRAAFRALADGSGGGGHSGRRGDREARPAEPSLQHQTSHGTLQSGGGGELPVARRAPATASGGNAAAQPHRAGTSSGRGVPSAKGRAPSAGASTVATSADMGTSRSPQMRHRAIGVDQESSSRAQSQAGYPGRAGLQPGAPARGQAPASGGTASGGPRRLAAPGHSPYNAAPSSPQLPSRNVQPYTGGGYGSAPVVGPFVGGGSARSYLVQPAAQH